MITDNVRKYINYSGMGLALAGIFVSVIITYTGIMYREEVRDLEMVRQFIKESDPALYDKIESDENGEYRAALEKTFVRRGNKPMIVAGVVMLILQVNILGVLSALALVPSKTKEENEEEDRDVVNLSEEEEIDDSF